MVQRKSIYILIITLVLLLDFEVFALTKLGNVATMLQVATSITGFLILLFRSELFLKRIFLLPMLFLALGFFSIYTSSQIFGQDFASGLIANIKLFAVGDAFLIYYLIQRAQFEPDELIRHIILMGTILFVLYLVIFVLNINIMSKDELSEGVEKMRKNFINLTAFLALTRFFNKGNYYFLVLGVILFTANHFGDIQRMVLVVFVLSASLLFILYRRRYTFIKFLMALVIFLPMAIYVIFSSSDLGTKLEGKFASIFALLDDQGTDQKMDNSVLARIHEVEYANKWIDKYPFSGVGKLRSGSKTEFIGDAYFHASDIGLIGLWYTHGIPGLSMFLIGILTLLSFRKRLNDHTRGFWIFGVFILLYSIFTGYCIYNPMSIILPLLLISLYQHETESTSSHIGAL